MPNARGAAQTARVSGSGVRPSSSMRSRRTSAQRTSEPPSQASGSGGTQRAGAGADDRQPGQLVAPAQGQRGERAAGRWEGPTPLPV